MNGPTDQKEYEESNNQIGDYEEILNEFISKIPKFMSDIIPDLTTKGIHLLEITQLVDRTKIINLLGTLAIGIAPKYDLIIIATQMQEIYGIPLMEDLEEFRKLLRKDELVDISGGGHLMIKFLTYLQDFQYNLRTVNPTFILKHFSEDQIIKKAEYFIVNGFNPFLSEFPFYLLLMGSYYHLFLTSKRNIMPIEELEQVFEDPAIQHLIAPRNFLFEFLDNMIKIGTLPINLDIVKQYKKKQHRHYKDKDSTQENFDVNLQSFVAKFPSRWKSLKIFIFGDKNALYDILIQLNLSVYKSNVFRVLSAYLLLKSLQIDMRIKRGELIDISGKRNLEGSSKFVNLIIEHPSKFLIISEKKVKLAQEILSSISAPSNSQLSTYLREYLTEQKKASTRELIDYIKEINDDPTEFADRRIRSILSDLIKKGVVKKYVDPYDRSHTIFTLTG